MIDWSKPIRFADRAISHIPVKFLVISEDVVRVLIANAFNYLFLRDGTPKDKKEEDDLFSYLKNDFGITFIEVVSLTNAESVSTNEELDKVLGELKNDYPKEQVTPEDSLEQSLGRIHRDLKGTLLRVEAQAFAVWVKRQKGTDIAEDYYQFRKHG